MLAAVWYLSPIKKTGLPVSRSNRSRTSPMAAPAVVQPRHRALGSRREGHGMLAERAGMQREAAVQAAAALQMRDRDPVVLRVPHNHRNRTKNEHNQQRVKTGAFELGLKSPRQREHEHDGEQLHRVRVFRQKSEA